MLYLIKFRIGDVVMCNILISIKPEYVEKILNGSKKYEYRKVKPRRTDISKLIIYSTSPVMRVVGEVEVLEIIEDTPKQLWSVTKHESGIKKSFYDSYYKSRKNACAFKLGKVVVYDKFLTLEEYGINFVPQSFFYLDEKTNVCH